MRPTSTAEQLARDKKVSLRLFKVIYKLFDDVLSELQKLLPSETVVTEVGKGEILAVFRKAEDGWIVGVKVKEGKIVLRLKMRLARGTEYVSEGEVLSLQMGKSEAKEIKAGQECGLRFKSKAKPEVGDMMEFYSEESRQRLLQIEGISKR